MATLTWDELLERNQYDDFLPPIHRLAKLTQNTGNTPKQSINPNHISPKVPLHHPASSVQFLEFLPSHFVDTDKPHSLMS